jgi:hypothetical protein
MYIETQHDAPEGRRMQQMPKFTKITTGGHPAYRFEHDGKTYRAHRYASGAGAWNVDRIDGDKRVPVVRGRDTRAAAVAAVVDVPAARTAADFPKAGSGRSTVSTSGASPCRITPTTVASTSA